MREVFKANWAFQLFFKLAKTRAITLNKTAYYRDDRTTVNKNLYLRLHECFHAIEQREQGHRFYIGYFLDIFKAWKHREDELQAIAFGTEYSKLYTKEHLDKTPTEYVQWVYDNVKIG